MRIQRSLFCVGLMLLLFSGCKDQARRQIQVDGLERYYLLHIPNDLPAKAPVVMALHGGTGSAEDMRRISAFEVLGQDEGFVTVYPNARYENWNDGRVGEKLRENAEGVNDLAYLEKVVEAVAGEVEIDEDRVFVTGPSNGGIMTYRLACSSLGARFAAIAPVIASIAVDIAPECEPARALPMLAINGEEDEFIRVEGGEVYTGGRGEVIPMEEAVQTLVNANQCQGDPVTSSQDDDPDDGTSLSTRKWAQCANGSQVEHILIEGGGHGWPGARRVLDAVTGTTSQEFNATQHIWNFFKRF